MPVEVLTEPLPFQPEIFAFQAVWVEVWGLCRSSVGRIYRPRWVANLDDWATLEGRKRQVSWPNTAERPTHTIQPAAVRIDASFDYTLQLLTLNFRSMHNPKYSDCS